MKVWVGRHIRKTDLCQKPLSTVKVFSTKELAEKWRKLENNDLRESSKYPFFKADVYETEMIEK